MYRFNVWAPPVVIWDIILEYVGFIAAIREKYEYEFDLYASLEASDIGLGVRREVYRRLGLDTFVNKLWIQSQIIRV